jgi:hypothetical protein
LEGEMTLNNRRRAVGVFSSHEAAEEALESQLPQK